jgi:hypothetical protein
VKEKEINKMKDSLRNAKEKLEQKIEKLDEKTGAPTEAYMHFGNVGYNFVIHI